MRQMSGFKSFDCRKFVGTFFKFILDPLMRHNLVKKIDFRIFSCSGFYEVNERS